MTSKPSFVVNNTSDFDEGDYVSPNLALIKVDACFPRMKRGDISSIPNPLFRKHILHNWYIDPDFPNCGFLSRDEAHILYNNALQFSGKRGVEIGSHVGWSTIHLALAGIVLDVIEPQLNQDPRVLLAIVDSLRRASVQASVNLVPGYSPASLHQLASQRNDKKWSLIFIDGNHDGDGPIEDAKASEMYAEDDAMIIFHDLAFPDVAKGWKYFHNNGEWKTRIYHTQQIIGIAWRGNVVPVEHVPDPRYSWDLPDHLKEFA